MSNPPSRKLEGDANTFPGLGMGLYISHEIVQQHGGSMWVDSAAGQGSTFSFSLPVREKE